ncbi:stage VI sporulation protein D [Bacillus tianshenii]|nr:stage VI sporulation protein D [Bacillus tianshenii]
MADVRSSNLRFHVQESVGFHRGQEVDDLVSIALEPEISIKENAKYVSIVGSLLLSAEYRGAEEVENDASIDSFRDTAMGRTVDEVNETEDGIYAMEHRFPIDITIPIERIADLNDVYVSIESFDYELPQSNRLQLSADIEISGILNEDREEEVETDEEAETVMEEEELEEVEQEEQEEDLEEVPSFEVEVRKEPELEEEEADDWEEEEKEPERDEPQIEVKARPEETELSVFREAETYDDVEEIEEIEEEAEPIAQEPAYEEPVIEREEELNEPVYEEPAEEQEEKGVENVKTHTRDDNALYLTKMLTNEREAFTKVKMRIIQEGESLDEIADNYEVPVTQILRVNKLESSNEIEQGQILYIPTAAGRIE